MTFTLVRSPRALIEKHQIGYGWASVNFSAYETLEDLFGNGFAGKDTRRLRNQIKRYFNLKSGDVVIVPLAKVVAFAVVEGTKSHSIDPNIKYGENRISVNYLTDKDGNVAYFPRRDLQTKLETRLKIRTSIASLDGFSGELETIVSDLKLHKIYTASKEIAEKREQEIYDFKRSLLQRLKSGEKIWIDANGRGLEELVQEIFQAHDYDTHIPGKNKVKGVADVDVIATKANNLTGDLEATLIQVKHHRGATDIHGIKQLADYEYEIDTYDYYRKVLVTTALVEKEEREEAATQNIKVIDGEALVDWIYDNINGLSENTQKKLGVILEPSLID